MKKYASVRLIRASSKLNQKNRNVVLHVRACACLSLHVCMYMCIRARDEHTNASKQSVV